MLTTDEDVNPTVEADEQAPDTDLPASSEEDPSNDDSPSTEELQEQLAAAETEAKRWKGRAEKATKEAKKDTPKSKADTSEYVTKEELWERDHKDELDVYQDRVDEIMLDGFEGAPIESKVVALAIAKSEAAKDNNNVSRTRQDDMTVPSSTRRNTDTTVELTEYDKRAGITAERKKELQEKHPALKNL